MPRKITVLLLFLISLLFLIPVTDSYARRNRVKEKIVSPVASKKVIPTFTPSPTLRPTSTPIPTKLPIKTPIPTKVLQARIPVQNTINNAPKTFIIQKINEYRQFQGLSSVATDPYTCNFAKIRAEEISRNFNHDGFRLRIDSKTLPYPGYKSITENIAMNSDYTKVVDQWTNSPGHAENMRKDTIYVCVESFGNYYAYEGWKP